MVERTGSQWLNQLLTLWEETLTCPYELSTGFCLLLFFFLYWNIKSWSFKKGKSGRLYLFLATKSPDTIQPSSCSLRPTLHSNKPRIYSLFSFNIISLKLACDHARWLYKVECLYLGSLVMNFLLSLSSLQIQPRVICTKEKTMGTNWQLES